MDRSVGRLMRHAVFTRNRQSVETLIDKYGLDYLKIWSGGYNLLVEVLRKECAAGSPNTDMLLLLLTKGAKVNTTKSHAKTPLHYATEASLSEISKELLNRGATVNASDEYGRTPLHVVTSSSRFETKEESNLEIIRLLLNSGANVNALDNAGGTPLLYAIESGTSKCVEMLVQHCTSINFKGTRGSMRGWVLYFHGGEDTFRGYTPLHVAVRNDNLEVVELLLENSADVNISTDCGETALHMTAENRSSVSNQMAKALINKGANVNAVFTSGNYEGYTPLHTAVLAAEKYNSCRRELIKTLLTSGANVNAVAKNLLTPLHATLKYGHRSEENLELLLKHGADPNILTKENKTALRVAVEKCSSKAVEHILKYCPDLNKDLDSDILRVALCNNDNFSNDVITQLLKHGYSVANEPAKESMFYEALKENCSIIVEELLKHGFEVNKLYKFKSSWSFMPLHLAVQKDRLSEVRLLISHGAEVNARDKTGKTPISYIRLTQDSELNAQSEILKVLLEKGANPTDNPGLLLQACEYGCMPVVHLLLDHADVDINAKDDSGVSALHCAALQYSKVQINKEPSLDIVKLLLDKNADVNAKTKTDLAVLHIAAMLDSEHSELLETLLEYNADVNTTCDTITALHLCAFNGNPYFCQILLKNGANVHAKLKNERTAVHIVASNPGILESQQKFHEALRCIAMDFGFSSILHRPSDYFSSEVTKVLVEFGANVNVKDAEGKSPLHYAAQNTYQDYNRIPILIKHGADWTARDNKFQTPLHYAAQCSLKNVRLLVEFGADINCKDADGCTPLHRLVQKESYNVSGLLHLGSDINVLNNCDQTPLEIAVSSPRCISSQRTTVINVLKNQIAKLRAANMNVDSKNLIAAKSVPGGDSDDYFRKCKCEVDNTKIKLIGESKVSFHKFLTSGRRELTRLARNDKLVQALETEKFDDFPIYASEFKLKVVYLRCAARRPSLLEKSKEAFGLCIAELPDLCMDEVFDHLSDDDLENIVRVHHPLEVFPKINDSKCAGYLWLYDHVYDYYGRHDYDYDVDYYDDDDVNYYDDYSYHGNSEYIDTDD